METAKQPATIEHLEKLPESESRFELIRGELIEMPPAGGEHGEIAAGIIGRLWAHVTSQSLGRVYTSETGFLIARNPDVLLAPDVAVIRSDRVPKRNPGFYQVAPDLVVEVVSPNDSASYVQRKVMEYLRAEVRIVWIVDPELRSITVYEGDAAVRFLDVDGVLDGGEVLPGFSVKVAEIFE